MKHGLVRILDFRFWILDCENPKPKTQNPKRVRYTQGQMLIIVLWVMGLVSVAIVALAVRSTHEVRLGRFPLETLQRRAIAQAGVQQAIALLREDDAVTDHRGEPWATGEDQSQQQRFVVVAVGSGTFSVGVPDGAEWHAGMIDEERKLNLNAADQAALESLITQIGQAGSASPADIAAAIVDWRDADSRIWCDERQLGYACHNAPFDSVDELRLVPGVTPALFAALEPYVTVYGSGLVNVNTAEPIVLRAVGVSQETIEAIMQQREARQPFTSSPDPANPILTVRSSAFTVPVEGEAHGSSGRAHLQAVIDRVGCKPNPPEGARCILAWSPR